MADLPILNRRYQLIEELGTGGMAEVFRARDITLERSVAIKVLREDYSDAPTFLQRFRMEARAAANLSHPNLVTIHDFGFDQGKFFIVMEHVPGTDLKTMITRLGRFKPEDAVPLMIQACAGIGYAHRAGLVHCDVKPHNMLVTPDRRLKVTDFGIARALATLHPGQRDDVVWGSPLYFAPEQAAGFAPSPASDVYSLGVVMYEMLTGKTPFEARNADILAELHRDATPRLPRELNLEISPALEQIILKTLAKEPAARYRNGDQLGRVLQSFGHAAFTSTPAPGLVTNEPANAPAAARSAAAPVPSAPAPNPEITPPMPKPVPVRDSPMSKTAPRRVQLTADYLDIDWVAVGLGLLALVAVGGLIPLWTWIIQLYNR
jgi:serine/threonine-protein kinase